MRILAMHDAEGNVQRIEVSPEDAPPGGVTPDPGLLLTEVEAPDISRLDLSDPASHQQIAEMLEHYRVEAEGGGARLVRKSDG
jgi:hypothetical protein